MNEEKENKLDEIDEEIILALLSLTIKKIKIHIFLLLY
jgi:hypothetical protein